VPASVASMGHYGARGALVTRTTLAVPLLSRNSEGLIVGELHGRWSSHTACGVWSFMRPRRRQSLWWPGFRRELALAFGSSRRDCSETALHPHRKLA